MGIAWHRETVARWQLDCVEALAAEPWVELVEFEAGLPTPPPAPGGPAWWRRLGVPWLEHRSEALRRVGAGTLPDRVEQGAKAIAQDCDLVLDLSNDAITPRVDDARLETWWFESVFVDGSGRPSCRGLRLLADGATTTSVVLRARTARGGDSDLGRATVRFRPGAYVASLDDALSSCAALLRGTCAAVLHRPEALLARGSNEPLRSTHRPEGMTTRSIARSALQWVDARARAVVFSPQWNVGVVDAPIHEFLEDAFVPDVRWLSRSRSGPFRADPFGLVGRGILFEHFDQATRLGSIVAKDECSDLFDSRPVIEIEGHASYPFLVEENGEIYCVPQIDEGSGVRVYRALRYPREWELAGELVPDVVARDPTVFRDGGRWWLAFTDGAAGPMTHLHLWWSEELFGVWKPHVANPVKIDARSARPAGTPFRHRGVLYRPAQDCSDGYGGAVAICRIDELGAAAFRETIVRVVHPLPGKYSHGIHTLSAMGNQTLVDGKEFVVSWHGSLHTIASKLSRRARARR